MSDDDLPDFQPLQRLPDREPVPLCDEEDCRWALADTRARSLLAYALMSSRQLFLMSEVLRAHGDDLIADVIEDSIMYLSNSIQPYIDAHLNPEEA